MAISPKDIDLAASASSLGEVLDSLSSLKPRTFQTAGIPRVMQTCGNGVVAGYFGGNVVFVSMYPEFTCYCLERSDSFIVQITSLAVSKSGQICLTGANDGKVRMWSLTEKKELATFEGHSKDITALVITHNDMLGISASSDTFLKVWDLQQRKETFTLEGNNRPVLCLELSANSQYLYSGDLYGEIKVWDLEERKEIATLTGHVEGVLCLAMSQDEKLMWSGSYDCTIRVWDLINRKEIAVFTEKTKIHRIRLMKNGHMGLSLTHTKEINLWNLATTQPALTLTGHTDTINDLTIFNCEKFCLTSAEDKSIRMWDLETGEEVMTFPGDNSITDGLKLTEDNLHVVSTISAGVLGIWSLERKKVPRVIEEFGDLIETLAITQDFVFGRVGCRLKWWSLEDCKEVGELQGQMGDFKAVAVTPDQKTLISADGNKTIRLWSLESKSLEHVFEDLGNDVSFLVATPDGKQFISATQTSNGLPNVEERLWSLEEKRVTKTNTYPCMHLKALAMRPDGACAAVAIDRDVMRWDFIAGQVYTFTAPGGRCTAVTYTPNGKLLVVCGDDGSVCFWEFGERDIITFFQGHSKRVNSVQASPDSRYVVSASEDCTVRVWSVEEQRQVACYSCQSEPYTAGFSSEGSGVVYSEAGKIHIVPFSVPWECAQSAPFQATFEASVIVKDLITGKKVSDTASKLQLSPYNVNCLHVCAFYNHAERCSEYLAAGVLFIKGSFGSPLTVALQRKTIKCVETFLKYLLSLATETKKDKEWPAFACIVEDIPALLECGSTLLQSFFEVLMQTPAIPVLPYFINPRSDLPIVTFSDNRLLHIADFDRVPNGETGSELVKFSISLIKQNLTPGSAPSLELVEALQACEDKTVLNTPYISTLIEQKWAYFYLFTLAFTLLYAAMLASLVMILFNVWNSVPLASAFVAINAFFIVYEMAQMLVDKLAYWMDPWNYVDIFRVFLSLFWGTLLLLGQEQSFLLEYQRNVRLILALLCLLRGFTYFRSFRTTRVFVYMTLAVIKEMYSFLFIMAYSVFAFGVCTSVLLGHTTLGDSWTSAFSLVLGDFDSSTFGFMEWTIFSCAAIINVVIMLNLLVSILGDAYGMTQMSVRENDLYMMLELVNEYESLMFWRRSAGTPVIMFTCDRALDAESADWAGQVSKITEKVKEEVGKSTETIESRVAELKEEQAKATKTIEQNTEMQNTGLKAVETELRTVEQRMTAMEGKLEAILGLLKDPS